MADEVIRTRAIAYKIVQNFEILMSKYYLLNESQTTRLTDSIEGGNC